MGSASVYQLAKRGAKVIGIDRFYPPHIYGSSHGETRITRQAIGEGEAYVPFVLRSHQIWRELESQTGASLLLQCGGLILSRASDQALHHHKPAFLQRTLEAAQKFGIEHAVLSAVQVMERFPQFQLEGDETGYFEPGAGLVNPELCIQAQLDQAKQLGADLRMGEQVIAIKPSAEGVSVQTNKGSYQVGKVIVSAGPWVGELLGEPIAKQMRIYRQVLFWLEPENPELYSPQRFPIFIWAHDSEADGHFYGFPVVSQGVKVAAEQDILSTPPDAVERTVSEAETVQMFEHHVQGRLKGLSNRCLKSATCLYTSTPDGDFVLDVHPKSERIIVASPCSGHGFKHSAAVGEAMAELSLQGQTRFDLSPFSLSRFSA